MSIESRRELEVTRAELKLLEERLAAVKAEPAENRRSQEWSVRSLTQTINQLKEAIARFESRARGLRRSLERRREWVLALGSFRNSGMERRRLWPQVPSDPAAPEVEDDYRHDLLSPGSPLAVARFPGRRAVDALDPRGPGIAIISCNPLLSVK